MAGGIVSNLMYAIGFKVNSRGIDKADAQVQSLSSSFTAAGLAAGVAVAAVIGFGATAISAAGQYENAMSGVQMATGATAEQMEETRGIAEELYKQNFGESWNDLGGAIASVQTVTGQTGDALQETTKDALLMRDAFGYDVGESVKSVDTMMKQFGITSDQAFSLLTQGAQNGLDKSGDLMDTANEYANQFKSLGFSAEDMFDTLAAGSENGAFNLDKVGDAVKEFNIRSKDGSKTSTQAFEALGLNADKMMHTFAAGGPAAKQAFTDIMSMLGDIQDPVQRNTIGVALMGSQFEDLEASTISAMGGAKSMFDQTKDKMDELNAAKINSPGQALSMLGRQLKTNLLIPFGQKLLPYIKQFSDWVTANQPQIEALANTLADGVGQAFTAIADGAKSVYDFVSGNWSTITDVVLAFGAALLVVKTYFVAMQVIGVVNKLMMAYRAGTLIATAAQMGLNMAMLANPMTWIVIGIAALIAGIVLLVRNWDTAKAAMLAVWDGIKAGFSWLWEGIKSIFAAIGDFFMTYWPYALGLILGPTGLLVGYIIDHWESIRSGIVNKATAIWDKIKSIWDTITGFLKGIDLLETGKNIIQGLINGIGNMKDAVVTKVKDIAGGITGGIKDFLGIHSPSRVMMEVGFFTGQGLAEGIAETEQMVAGASIDVAGAAVQMPEVARTARQLPAARAESRSELYIKLDMGGSAAGATAATAPEDERVKRLVQDAMESALRRLGLDGEVSYG